MFQDGICIIAQAVDQVVAQRIPYFSELMGGRDWIQPL
jgi:hypothetical protein